jgi:hypothetical protein
MDREKQIRAAQLAILARYNLVADCSELDETVLERIIKGLPSLTDEDDLTFASWCDQVIGKGIRLPIARFEYHVAGQTRLSSLTDGYDLAQGILGREKEQQASVRTYRREIKRLEAELAVKSSTVESSTTPESIVADDFSRCLRDWYGEASASLRHILWGIKEVDGVFFNHQGLTNRDYRSHLIDVILPTLNRLEGLGFGVKVELHDVSNELLAVKSIIIYESQATTFDEYSRESFAFVVEDVQADILDIAESCLLDPTRLAPTASESRPKLNCQVNVSMGAGHPAGEDEFFHLSCFLQKLFSALAKSSDHVARGILREKVLLCLLLSWTAPCMPARERMEHRWLSEIFDRNLPPHYTAKPRADSDLSAGQIVDHLFSVMREHLSA